MISALSSRARTVLRSCLDWRKSSISLVSQRIDLWLIWNGVLWRWHDAGTYDAQSKTGGPNGSIRNEEEYTHGANSGLKIALELCGECVLILAFGMDFELLSWEMLSDMLQREWKLNILKSHMQIYTRWLWFVTCTLIYHVLVAFSSQLLYAARVSVSYALPMFKPVW